jgi:hypothetical protein
MSTKYTTTPELRELREKADAAIDAYIRATEARRYELGIYDDDNTAIEVGPQHVMTGCIAVAQYQEIMDEEADQIIVIGRGSNTTTTVANGMICIASQLV